MTTTIHGSAPSHDDQAPVLPQGAYLFPLSFGQERLWLLEHLTPGTAVYTMIVAAQLIGPLERVALQISLNSIVARHESLRTTFQIIDGQPNQVILPSLEAPLVSIDLRSLPRDEALAQAGQLTAAEAQHRFALDSGPLMRATLLRFSEHEHRLLICFHHGIFDGGSVAVLWAELGALYAALEHGQPSPLAELPIQYADYAVWEREQLQGSLHANLRAYWTSQLTGNLVAPHLPYDHAGPFSRPPSARRMLAISPELSAEIRQLARRQGVTPFMLLLAAFEALLHGYSQQERFFLCTTASNRTEAETQGLIGYFTNLVILTADCSGAPTFEEFVQRVGTTVMSAYSHRALPIQQVTEALSLTGAPLSRLLFGLEPPWQPPERLGSLLLQPVDADNEIADFDLFLGIHEIGVGLTVAAKFNARAFSADTIAALLTGYQTLLESIVAAPEQRLSDLPRPLTHLAHRRVDSPQPSPQRPHSAADLAEPAATPAPSAITRPMSGESALREPTGPAAGLERQLAAIWQHILGRAAVGRHDHFFELGGHSLLAVALFAEIEQVFGRRLSLQTLFEAPTIAQQAALLSRQGWQATWSSLVALKATGSRPPFFCIHPHGGNLIGYRRLAHLLGDDQPVFGLQAIGLDGTQPPLTRVEAMALHYVREIRSRQPHGPYALGGYCFGGTVAWEIAHQLQAQGQEVSLLALFEAVTPNFEGDWSTAKRVRVGLERQRQRLQLHRAALGRLPWREQRTYLQQTARRAINAGVERGWRLFGAASTLRRPSPLSNSIQRVQEANLQADRAYQPRYYQGRPVLFITHYPGLDEIDHYRGWQGLASDGIELHRVSGDHFTLLDEPHVADLAALLRQRLMVTQPAPATTGAAASDH